MSQKPDYYEVLGVAKTASVDEIKSAFKKIAMKCHPDMLRNKSEAEKKAAGEKFQLAKEANEILTDASKRATYDKYGHKGLENVKSGTGNSQSYTDAAGPLSKKTFSEDNVFDFFEKRTASTKKETEPSDGLTPEERREKNRQQRLKNRGATNNNTTSSANDNSSGADAFNEVADKVSEASSLLKDAVVPIEALEKFRENLQDFLKEIDVAISRARKYGGPQA